LATRRKIKKDMEIAVATELTSTTITNILEAVPGIKTVLRSPAADAMVNLTRAAAGLVPFEIKYARELMRFAFRRGLINNEEHDTVLADVEGATKVKEDRLAARKAARDDKKRTPHKPRAAAALRRPKVHAAHRPKKAKVAKKVGSKGKAKPAKKSKKPTAKKSPAKAKKRR
jgi:hypothetical protein